MSFSSHHTRDMSHQHNSSPLMLTLISLLRFLPRTVTFFPPFHTLCCEKEVTVCRPYLQSEGSGSTSLRMDSLHNLYDFRSFISLFNRTFTSIGTHGCLFYTLGAHPKPRLVGQHQPLAFRPLLGPVTYIVTSLLLFEHLLSFWYYQMLPAHLV